MEAGSLVPVGSGRDHHMPGGQSLVQSAAGPKEQDLLRTLNPDLLQNAHRGGTADSSKVQSQRLSLVGKAVNRDFHTGADGIDVFHRKAPLQRLHHPPLEGHQHRLGKPLHRLGQVGGLQQLLAAVEAMADHW